MKSSEASPLGQSDPRLPYWLVVLVGYLGYICYVMIGYIGSRWVPFSFPWAPISLRFATFGWFWRYFDTFVEGIWSPRI